MSSVSRPNVTICSAHVREASHRDSFSQRTNSILVDPLTFAPRLRGPCSVKSDFAVVCVLTFCGIWVANIGIRSGSLDAAAGVLLDLRAYQGSQSLSRPGTPDTWAPSLTREHTRTGRLHRPLPWNLRPSRPVLREAGGVSRATTPESAISSPEQCQRLTSETPSPWTTPMTRSEISSATRGYL